MLKSWSRQAPTMLVGLLLVGALFAGQSAFADHEPANKVAASGSTVEVAGPGERIVVLQERVKMSGPTDLILALSAECDILTELTVGGGDLRTDRASAFGQVRMWIEIDGKTVPITATDSSPSAPGTAGDDGKVVFCNRAHEKEVTDTENNPPNGDGTDEEPEMTQTRQANAFNWLALDTGFNYDSPTNGNNILDIVVYAEFTDEVDGRAVAEALIGNRTLIAEPTNASNHEWVSQNDAGGN